VLNSEGKSTEYQIICRDITDLKAYFERSQSLLKEIQTREIKLSKQNEELRKLQRYTELSEMRYRDLYDKVPAGILTLDIEGRIISLNLTATQFIGRSRKYLIGQIFSNFISQNDLETFSDFLLSLFRAHKKQT
jgi:PAS domain-containing protein